MRDRAKNPEKIKILIFANEREMQKYFNLFKVLLGDKCKEIRDQKYYKLIETDKAIIDFAPPTHASRGKKVHYVLNLTQDEEFHHCVALPLTIMNSYLDKEGKWSELFDKI